MFCELYRQALSDAAAAGKPLPRELSAHLHTCDSCSSAFAAEQCLLARIDRSLEACVNAEVPVTVVARVQAQIAVNPAMAAWRVPALTFATLSLVAAVAALWPLVHRQSIVGRSTINNAAITGTIQSSDKPDVNRAAVQAAPPLKWSFSGREKVIVTLTRAHPGVEVLVSSEELAGLERYAARLRAGTHESSARAAAADNDPAFNIRSLEIAAIDLRQLSIEPLETDEYN